MLKEEATDDLIRDFEREASLLAEFEHPNIVKLLGVCAIGKPMCLLFEFMSKGDLNAYLRSCSPSNYIVRCNGGSTTSSTFSDVKISHIEQVTISKQITTGMIYLSGMYCYFLDLNSISKTQHKTCIYTTIRSTILSMQRWNRQPFYSTK